MTSLVERGKNNREKGGKKKRRSWAIQLLLREKAVSKPTAMGVDESGEGVHSKRLALPVGYMKGGEWKGRNTTNACIGGQRRPGRVEKLASRCPIAAEGHHRVELEPLTTTKKVRLACHSRCHYQKNEVGHRAKGAAHRLSLTTIVSMARGGGKL